MSTRVSHNSDAFYSRFPALTQSNDTTINTPTVVDTIATGDSRHLTDVTDNSVALVVTSPPYFVGKDYELERGNGGVPETYVDYLGMLHDVFKECWRTLEPGGRIAINVANLGRKPYRSLSADIIRIIQDDIGFLMKAKSSGKKPKQLRSCAWGSFQSAANPVLRDVTNESSSPATRLDRALTRKQREQAGLPINTISKEEFMDATLDIWQSVPNLQNASGIAPFPVDLPKAHRALHLPRRPVLDPFMGAGTQQ